MGFTIEMMTSYFNRLRGNPLTNNSQTGLQPPNLLLLLRMICPLFLQIVRQLEEKMLEC